MTSLYINVGSLVIIDAIRTLLASCRLRLFSNNVNLVPGTQKSELTECVFGGYAVKTISALLPAFLDPAGGASSQVATVQWDCNGLAGDTVRGAWLETSGLTGVVADASNATPIVITDVAHGLSTGDRVTVADVTGNTAANGTWTVTVLTADTFELDGSVGNGAYVSGGTWESGFTMILAMKFDSPITMQNFGDSLPLDVKINFGAAS